MYIYIYMYMYIYMCIMYIYIYTYKSCPWVSFHSCGSFFHTMFTGSRQGSQEGSGFFLQVSFHICGSLSIYVGLFWHNIPQIHTRACRSAVGPFSRSLFMCVRLFSCVWSLLTQCSRVSCEGSQQLVFFVSLFSYVRVSFHICVSHLTLYFTGSREGSQEGSPEHDEKGDIMSNVAPTHSIPSSSGTLDMSKETYKFEKNPITETLYVKRNLWNGHINSLFVYLRHLSLCVYVYAYIYINNCIHIYICIYLYIYMYNNVYRYMYVYMYVYIDMYMYTNIYIYTYMYMFMYVYRYMYI